MPMNSKASLSGPLIIVPLGGDGTDDMAATLLTLLARAEAGRLPRIILVPDGEDDLARLAAGLGDGAPLQHATHGSVPEPGSILVLPVGRHFVLEAGRLALRPPLNPGAMTRLERFVASLAEVSASTLLVAPQGEAILPPEARYAFTQAGGRIVLPSCLDTEALPDRDARRAGRSAPHDPTLAHEVRQPLQTLVLLQSLLKRAVQDPRQRAIVDRMGETLAQLGAILTAPPPAGQRPLMPWGESGEDAPASDPAGGPMLVHVIDDDASIREAVRAVLEAEGSTVRDYGRCEQFLAQYGGEGEGCLLVDAYLPGMSGLDLLEEMGRRGHPMPTIVMTGSSDVRMAVSAMKMGATDFLEKPVTGPALVACVRAALARARNADMDHLNREKAMQALKGLTKRQRQIMTMVLDGHPSKNIAADLGISQRTVENHRAAIMRRTGSRSLPQLARLILALPTLEIE